MSEEEEFEEIQKKRIQERLKAIYVEEKKREILGRFLEANAYERVMNVKHANPALYDKVVEVIVQLVSSGRLNRRLSETEFLTLVSRLTERKEPTIEIKRK